MSQYRRITLALDILWLWFDGYERYRNSSSSMDRRTALRFKAIGIVQHDRILNERPAPPIPVRTLSQIMGLSR